MRVGGTYFAQQNKTAIPLIVYKAFQFIFVDYGDRKSDSPSQERDEHRPVRNKEGILDTPGKGRLVFFILRWFIIFIFSGIDIGNLSAGYLKTKKLILTKKHEFNTALSS